MPPALLAVPVLAHLALPWVLRRVAERGGRVAWLVRGRVDAAYGWTTVALGVLAVLAAAAAGTGHPALLRPPHWLWPVLAVVAGAGCPLLAAGLAGRPRRFARRSGAVPRVVLCAAGEEALWRLAAFGGLSQAGLPEPVAGAVAVLGFAVLHVPRAGRRAVPYLVVLGTLLTALAALGGLLAAVLCHSGHNLVLSATARRRSGRAPAGLPPSRTWS